MYHLRRLISIVLLLSLSLGALSGTAAASQLDPWMSGLVAGDEAATAVPAAEQAAFQDHDCHSTDGSCQSQHCSAVQAIATVTSVARASKRPALFENTSYPPHLLGPYRPPRV